VEKTLLEKTYAVEMRSTGGWDDHCVLTCALIFDAALALALKLGADRIQQFVQSLAGCADRRHHTARRVAVVHGGGGLRKTMGRRAGLLGCS